MTGMSIAAVCRVGTGCAPFGIADDTKIDSARIYTRLAPKNRIRSLYHFTAIHISRNTRYRGALVGWRYLRQGINGPRFVCGASASLNNNSNSTVIYLNKRRIFAIRIFALMAFTRSILPTFASGSSSSLSMDSVILPEINLASSTSLAETFCCGKAVVLSSFPIANNSSIVRIHLSHLPQLRRFFS